MAKALLSPLQLSHLKHLGFCDGLVTYSCCLQLLEKGCVKAGVGLFFQAVGDRTRENCLKLFPGEAQIDIRKKFFTERVNKH